PHEVRCPLDLAEPYEGEVGFDVSLASEKGQTRFGIVGGEVRGGTLIFDDDRVDSLHRGRVTVPGFLEADVTWTPRGDGADCPRITLVPAAVVVGTVRPKPRGGRDGMVWVRGCGGFVPVEADGTFYLDASPGPCELVAERQDGW